MDNTNLPFWKSWGFWGLILILGQIPFPFNPIAILLSPLGFMFNFQLRWAALIIGLLLCVVGLFRDGKNKWWAMVGIGLLVGFILVGYIALSRF